MAFLDHETFFVFGLARSGRAVAALLAERGYRVVAYDEERATLEAFADSEDRRAVADRVAVANGATWRSRLEEAGCLVLSPGVPLDHELVAHARARGVAVVGEVEAAYHFCDATLVGVTGTNGKSTVVGVIGEILRHAGLEVAVAGNVGRPFADAVRKGGRGVFVLELSSFQLDTIDRFAVAVAVLLNVTPDHLDRYHNSFDEYAASKARILNRSDEDTLYVYNAEDETAAALSQRHVGALAAFSSRRRLDRGVYLEDGAIVRRLDGRAEEVAPRAEFTPVGVHNLENAMAAVAAVTPFDVPSDVLRAALHAYRALPHRMELVRVVDGVAYVNDSKATNVDATAKSLESVEGATVLILGGRDKDGDFAALVPHLGRVRLVVLIGEAAGVIRRSLEGHCAVVDAEDMARAVAAAAEATEPGDTVLLAPACSSFDMFENYEARGRAFRSVVNSL
jgi:UDP-N-acetylmuramoylalanine--D-glutamate ligase